MFISLDQKNPSRGPGIQVKNKKQLISINFWS